MTAPPPSKFKRTLHARRRPTVAPTTATIACRRHWPPSTRDLVLPRPPQAIMVRGLGSKRRVAEEESSEEEYEVEVVRDHIASSRGSRLALFGSELRLGRFRPRRRRRLPLAGEGAAEGFFHGLVIHPDNKYVIDAVPTSLIICFRSFRFRARDACCLLWKLPAARSDATRRARSVGVGPIVWLPRAANRQN